MFKNSRKLYPLLYFYSIPQQIDPALLPKLGMKLVRDNRKNFAPAPSREQTDAVLSLFAPDYDTSLENI